MVVLPAEDVDEVEVSDEVDGLQREPAGAEDHHHRDQHAVRLLMEWEGRKLNYTDQCRGGPRLRELVPAAAITQPRACLPLATHEAKFTSRGSKGDAPGSALFQVPPSPPIACRASVARG